MDETQSQKKSKTEGAAENTEAGNEPQTSSVLDRADAAAERIEKGIKRLEELQQRQEELSARAMLGGGSEAGGEPAKEKELTPEEYSKKVLKGEINPLEVK